MGKRQRRRDRKAIAAASRYISVTYGNGVLGGQGSSNSASYGHGVGAYAGGGGAVSFGYASGNVVSARGGGGAVSGGGGLPGCTCPMCAGRFSFYTVGPPRGAAGMRGFAGKGQQDFDFAAGSVLGFRWWMLNSPDFSRDPLTADEHWPVMPLAGQTGYFWDSGVIESVCNYVSWHKPPVEFDDLTGDPCGCGCWAYWKPQSHSGFDSWGLPVLGVIKGTGRTLIGEEGFRSQKAQIVALHLPSFTRAKCAPEVSFIWYDATTGKPVIPPQSPVEEDRIATWMAAIETRLETMYPGVDICTRYETLVAKYKPNPAYARADGSGN